MTESQKAWIDNASYEDLLQKWRYAPAGDPFFAGDVGDYYGKVMRKKKAAAGHDASVQASKNVGWDPQ